MTTANDPMFQSKFNALAKAAEVTPDEESVAKFFWYAGLRHAFQRGTSQAALFQPAPTAPQQEPAVPSMPNPWVGLNKEMNDMKRYKGYESELSPYEAKLMSLLLKDILTGIEENISEMVQMNNILWRVCDKEDPKTEPIFDTMNRLRTKLKTMRKQYNTFAGVQRKLKKLSKGL